MLSASQKRSQAIIELPYKKALVAAKVWASLYPNTGNIIHAKQTTQAFFRSV